MLQGPCVDGHQTNAATCEQYQETIGQRMERSGNKCGSESSRVSADDEDSGLQ